MQVSVAIPAIDKIVTNYINLVADCTGDVLDPEDAVAVLLGWKSDSIFDLLVEDANSSKLLKSGTSNGLV